MMSLSKINQVVEGFKSGPDVTIYSISTDSRALSRGALFVAIHGEHFDGHDFVEKAALMGAAAAIVDREVETNIPTVLVPNTTKALGELAAYWREQFILPIIAVTGSCGKTTVRAMCESIFSQRGKTLASIKSFNNEIGVPLTLLNLSDEYDYAVVEMGMNHAGEIEVLTNMAKPDVAIVTCIAPVHLEALHTLENIAKAKAEIFSGLAKDGIAIINNDDDFADLLKHESRHFKQVTFAIEKAADVSAKAISFDELKRSHFTLVTPKGEIAIKLPLMGRHNIMNALASAAAALTQDLSLEQIKQGLESVESVERRLRKRPGINGATIIDDSYNANPASMVAAIDILASHNGDSILVFGDMLELGEKALDFHQQIGKIAQSAGIKHLYCYGKLTQSAAEAFGSAAHHFDDQAALIQALRPKLTKGATVLVKGSNGMKMNNIVQAIIED